MVKVMDVIGENLKNIRLSLKLSRKEFAQGVIDSSYLAHIEKNKNEIRAITLVKLLDQNEISILEFLDRYGNTEKKNEIYEEQASQAFFNRDVDILDELLENSAYPNLIIRQVVCLMRDKLLCRECEFSDSRKKIIKRFLLATDSWNDDCLWVIANALEVFEDDEVCGIISLIARNYTEFDKYSDRRIKLLAQIIVNFLELCLKHKVPIWKINKIFSYMNKLPNRPVIFYEKARLATIRIKDFYDKDYNRNI